MMETCIIFPAGHKKHLDIDITFDKFILKKIIKLVKEYGYKKHKVLENYYIFYFPDDLSNQNTIFHKYNGQICLIHKNRNLNDSDADFLQNYSNKVLLKEKRLYIPCPPEIKKSTSLRIL